MTSKHNVYLVAMVIYTSLVTQCQSGKILLLPSDHLSFVNMFKNVAEILLAKGHEVTMVTRMQYKDYVSKIPELELLLYDSPAYSKIRAQREQMATIVKEDKMFKQITLFGQIQKVADLAIEDIKVIFSNSDIMDKLQTAHFDLAIVDGSLVNRYSYIIPYYLDLKYMTLAGICTDPWNYGMPVLPSIEPYLMTAFSNKMTFGQRCGNLFKTLLSSIVQPTHDNTVVKHLVPNKPVKSLKTLYADSELYMVTIETTVIDYPRISMPSFRYIYGLGIKDAKPLQSDLETIMQQSKGVVIVTFGSAAGVGLTNSQLKKFLAAFKEITLTVLMCHVTDIPSDINIPDNVHIRSWIPQNDILGHPKTKLFISHGGGTGQMEAVYHAVPMLTFPMGMDQTFNALRVKVKGYSETMDISSFTSEELQRNIEKITRNQSYQESIKRASEILHDYPSSQKEIAFWVNHVIKFGGAHLRSQNHEMSFYQLYMLDVLVATGLLIKIMLWLLCCGCMKCCGYKMCVKDNRYKQNPHTKLD